MPPRAMDKTSDSKLFADRYKIKRQLGAGGSGAVFLAWDEQLHRHVAIKRWSPPEPLLDDPEGTERLWREAMTLAAIQHPNILTIHDFGVDQAGPYVITEFVDGETLDEVVKRQPLDLDTFADAARQTLEALIAAHQAGLIHRDLKPQNIMRTRLPSGAWQYKILDFGLARFVTRPTVQSLEGNTSIYGSILYIAPEQLRHQPLDARTDIYAIGCVFYFMLSGQNAVEGDTIPSLITSHLEHRFKPLSEWRPDLPRALCNWVMKAMEVKPEDRYSSAADALAALRRILPDPRRTSSIRVTPAPSVQAAPSIRIMPPKAQKAAAPAPTVPTPPQRAPLPRWIWPMAAVLGLAVVAAVFLLLHKPEPDPAAAPPVAPAAPIRWATDPQPVEEVITLWPPTISEARRPKVQQYFEMMRDMREPHWGSIGAVLETLAVVQFNSRNNPEKLRALGNLTYHDATGRTLGEIDMVIWDMQENRAIAVYEAVVSDQLHRKGTSSRNQIQRFADAIRDGQVARILHPDDRSWNFQPEQFEQARIEIMGSQGALAAGFDYEVDLTRFEADFLQRKLLDWRNKHYPKKKK